VITPLADHPEDAAVDDEHGAGPAGGHPAIQGGPRKGDSPLCRLADGVLLRVNRPDAMSCDTSILMNHFFDLMSHFVAVGEPGRSPDIAGNQELVVFGNDAAGSSPVAGSPLGDGFANFHKIFIPARPYVSNLRHLFSNFSIGLFIKVCYIVSGVTRKILSYKTYQGFLCKPLNIW
jgi:hypothetical protein